MGKLQLGRLLRGRDRTGRTTVGRDVDVSLVIEAARLVVTTRVATTTNLQRHLDVPPHVADQLMGRLEHCEVVGPEQPGRSRRVITTAGELPGVIEEFRHRG